MTRRDMAHRPSRGREFFVVLTYGIALALGAAIVLGAFVIAGSPK